MLMSRRRTILVDKSMDLHNNAVGRYWRAVPELSSGQALCRSGKARFRTIGEDPRCSRVGQHPCSHNFSTDRWVVPIVRRRPTVRGLALGLVAVAFVAGLTFYRPTGNEVIVYNDTGHQLDRVRLRVPTQVTCLEPLSPGARRRVRIMPFGDLHIFIGTEKDLRYAPVAYLPPWHQPFRGVWQVSVKDDSVTIRQRTDFSRPIIPRWRSYSVPLQDGSPGHWVGSPPQLGSC